MAKIWKVSRRRRVRLAAVVGGLLASALACGPASQGTNALEARPLTKHERELLADAEDALVQRCMRRHGFEVFLTEPPTDPAHDLPFGNDSLTFAREHGLGFGSVNMLAFRAANPNIRYVQELSEARQAAYGTALDGNRRDPVTVRLPTGFQLSASTKGCTAEAEEQLYGDFRAWFRTRSLVENLPGQYYTKVLADRRYGAALANWASCMAERGYRVRSPGELREKFAPRESENGPVTRKPPKAEIAAATAEADCTQRTKLARLGRQLERTHRKEVYAANRRLITDYQAMSVAALERAKELRHTSELSGKEHRPW